MTRLTTKEFATLLASNPQVSIQSEITTGTAIDTLRTSTGTYKRGQGGKRADLDNAYYRSAWEANYARYLNWLKGQGLVAEWGYEILRFTFDQEKRGCRDYTPDFHVRWTNGEHEWHEVKGWMDAVSKSKLKKMRKYYPAERVVIIGPAEYRAIAKQFSGLPGWE
jgi:hypothetical protein